jgi:hypothetical protein
LGSGYMVRACFAVQRGDGMRAALFSQFQPTFARHSSALTIRAFMMPVEHVLVANQLQVAQKRW